MYARDTRSRYAIATARLITRGIAVKSRAREFEFREITCRFLRALVCGKFRRLSTYTLRFVNNADGRVRVDNGEFVRACALGLFEFTTRGRICGQRLAIRRSDCVSVGQHVRACAAVCFPLFPIWASRIGAFFVSLFVYQIDTTFVMDLSAEISMRLIKWRINVIPCGGTKLSYFHSTVRNRRKNRLMIGFRIV